MLIANWMMPAVCHLLVLLAFSSKTQTCSQGISSAIIFYDGFRLQIHPEITISHPKLITMAQLNGFFKAIYSMIGRLLVPSCGFMESVCSFCSPLRDVGPNHLDSVAGSGKSVLWFVLPRPILPYHPHTVNSVPQLSNIS